MVLKPINKLHFKDYLFTKELYQTSILFNYNKTCKEFRYLHQSLDPDITYVKITYSLQIALKKVFHEDSP